MQSARKYMVPGRINLIGEHTDYNDGLVLPGAVDQHLVFEVEEMQEGDFRFYSGHFDEEDQCDAFGKGSHHSWSKFFCQVIRVMTEKRFPIRSIKCSFQGNLPIGAGMSSSSALACGLIYALNDLFDLRISKRDMVFLASEAENSSGLDGGKMDQYSILFGEKDHVLKIDCRDYTHDLVRVTLDEYSIVLFDTKVEHVLVDTAYNDRHAECKKGFEIIQKYCDKINSVRDLSLSILENHQASLDPISFKRLSFVQNENNRVNQAIHALQKNNLKDLGQLMYQSHDGLQHEYEVSCKELDFIVNWCRENEAILGARMMGGGFGGCVIAIVKKEEVDDVATELKISYRNQFDFDPGFYTVQLSQGIHRIS